MKARRSVSPARKDAPGMRAGEVAKTLGVGVQTLHFYEREGLIPTLARTASGYRVFSTDDFERLLFIRKAQALGLPLNEIREILQLTDQGATPCGRVQAALTAKLAEVNKRLAELQAFRDELSALVAGSAHLASQRDDVQSCPIVEGAKPLDAQTAGPYTLATRRHSSAHLRHASAQRRQ